MGRSAAVTAWAARGAYRQLAGHRIFTVDVPAAGPEDREPLLVVHGFPTSSFDFRLVVDRLAVGRRVHLVDLLGYGLSAKPDIAYGIDVLADVVAAYTAAIGLTETALLTHDLGDTVGGELLARQMEGRWPVDVTRRVLTNGSIYIGMAHLSTGQQLLLSLPDERLGDDALVTEAGVAAGVVATFAERSEVSDDDVTALAELVAAGGGLRLLPRLVRYIEERRRREGRFTGAIERHPSPVTVVWGTDDPIAVAAMASRFHAARPDARLTWLDGVGHYPMLEDPDRFADAVLDGLDGLG
jgi:pimeloyl-ACP methyl ester carboxylesterase